MAIHTCPVCGTRHEVPAVLHGLACGRQLTCSPHCKTVFPRLARTRVLAEMAQQREHGPRLTQVNSGPAPLRQHLGAGCR